MQPAEPLIRHNSTQCKHGRDASTYLIPMRAAPTGDTLVFHVPFFCPARGFNAASVFALVKTARENSNSIRVISQEMCGDRVRWTGLFHY